MATVPSGVSGHVVPPELTSSLKILYYSLEIAAIIFIGLGILPALCTGRVSRTITWYSFMFSWMWYSVANVILAGRQSSTEPSFSLCLFQSGLIYASPVFISATGLAFIIELYLRLGSPIPDLPLSRSRLVPLIVLPILLNCTVFLEVIIYGLHNKSTVRLNSLRLYCHIETDVQTTFASLLVILLLVPVIIIEALTATMLYCKYKHIHNNEASSPFSLTLFIRTVFFTFIVTIGLTIGAIDLRSPSHILQAGQMTAQASVPVTCALVFLTQTDIVRSWSLRRRSSSASAM
ncbi:hypothetical protein B0H14DRAFT_2707834 [Mycena olivaceomarginata]|nr:hypothetical protein B0H14DRAFT_2707834 [Mycena olivaceomarginata]